MSKAAIIGGGASGMMAALTASGLGHEVILFERQARVGKKLLATGNGRCNLTNLGAAPERYHGEDAGFMRTAFGRFGVQDTLKFFRSHGLVTVAEASGRVYPRSDAANSVTDVLRFALEQAGVDMRLGCEVMSARKVKGGFIITTDAGEEKADKLIICAGGAAGSKVGGSSRGYELLASFGHTRTKLCPSLTQIRTDPTYPRSLKGVRADAGVKLIHKGRVCAESAGEVQFVEYGVSGPAVFDVSRAASTLNGDLTVELDLMRDWTEEALFELIRSRTEDMPQLTLENLLTGILHNRLGQCVIRYGGRRLTDAVSSLRPGDIRSIVRDIRHFELEVRGVNGFDSAQVTAGGIRTEEFDPETLESRLVPGLFAAGEVLDIDGDCGGFNLQWAWSSGHTAGRLGK